jgi:hypothetical protein
MTLSEGGHAYLARATYSFEEAIALLAALAAHHRGGHTVPARPFSEGGPIQSRRVRADAAFVPSSQGFADALAALESLSGLERYACLGVWRDGARVQDVARRLHKRDSMVWAAFYAGTEAALRILTGHGGTKGLFRAWRESRRNRPPSDGPL